MVDVIEEAGQKLVTILQDIQQTNKEFETKKMELQVDKFGKSMEYKRTRDEQNSKMIKLLLQNQGLRVQAIAYLADAVERRLLPQPRPPPTSTTSPTDEAYEEAADVVPQQSVQP